MTRSTFLTTATTAAVTTLLPTTIFPSPAFAKFGESIYVSPSAAVVDREVLGSAPVQKSVESLVSYKAAVTDLCGKLKSDGQADLVPAIRTTFDFALLRTSLNTLGTAFDEDTQRSLDRISRLIIQDVQELEAASAFKGGGRSEIRRANVEKKLNKLEGAFGELLAFAK